MWERIIQVVEWFGDVKERVGLVRNFNHSAKAAFITGVAPTLLKVSVSKGNSNYRHAFSKFLASGFRIKALSGRSLSRAEMIDIGKIILANETMVRKLISLGWDTLEVHDNAGYNGLQWKLTDFAHIGGVLEYPQNTSNNSNSCS